MLCNISSSCGTKANCDVWCGASQYQILRPRGGGALPDNHDRFDECCTVNFAEGLSLEPLCCRFGFPTWRYSSQPVNGSADVSLATASVVRATCAPFPAK